MIKKKNWVVKTDLSDLQGAWSCLRDTVVNNEKFPEQGRLVFHIDEVMSWECVRDLKEMKKSLLLISNIIIQSEVNSDVEFWLEEVRESFQMSLTKYKK